MFALSTTLNCASLDGTLGGVITAIDDTSTTAKTAIGTIAGTGVVLNIASSGQENAY